MKCDSDGGDSGYHIKEARLTVKEPEVERKEVEVEVEGRSQR